MTDQAHNLTQLPRPSAAYVQQHFLAMDEDGFVLGVEEDFVHQQSNRTAKYVATEILAICSYRQNDIATALVTEETVAHRESQLMQPEAEEPADHCVKMASKLYAQYVRPEQDLLAFGPAELHDIVDNFSAARDHLEALEQQNVHTEREDPPGTTTVTFGGTQYTLDRSKQRRRPRKAGATGYFKPREGKNEVRLF